MPLCYLGGLTTSARKVKKAPAKKKVVATKKDKPSIIGLPPKSIGVRELRQNASKLLDIVKSGAIIEITEHGVPVARLTPIKRSLYEEYLESGLIKPALNPNWRPTKNPVKIKDGRISTEVLLAMRAEERY
jgi:prevent-host-death family protein